MAVSRKKALLIDSNALIYRAYHAVPPFKTKDGRSVGAVYGFASTLLKAIEDIRPDYVAAAFDLSGPTVRHEIYEEYKAHRVKAPDDLYEQIPYTQEILNALNIPILTQEGYEADDVIGSLARIMRLDGSSIDVYIVTGDMDIAQLINDHVFVYTLKKSIKEQVVYDARLVKEKYGFGPEYVVDYKALRGDPSDNIPGVKGIGEKTAISLIDAHGGIEGIYAALDNGLLQATDRVRQLLEEGRESALLSYQLATIKTDLMLPEFDLSTCEIHNLSFKDAVSVFLQYEFKSLVPRLQKVFSSEADQSSLFALHPDESRTMKAFDIVPIIVNTQEAWMVLCQKLSSASIFAFDTETTGLSPIDDDLVGISFAVGDEAFYVPVGHTGSDQLPVERIVPDLRSIFCSEAKIKIAHNAKFDLLILRKYGIEYVQPIFDTMIASSLIDPTKQSHSLDALAMTELGHQNIAISELIGSGRNQIRFSEVPVEKAAPYACEDSLVALKLYYIFIDQIKSDEILSRLFYDIEMPVMDVLVALESKGILLDAGVLSNISEEVDAVLSKVSADIIAMAGEDFNINSTQQLSAILFNKLGIDSAQIKKTKTGISTAASELEKMRDLSPIIPLILEYRELTKLKSTYLDALPRMTSPHDGRLHTSYHQVSTATGRMSSTDPNLQNIPIRTPLGAKVREAFVAPAGYELVAFDYSQIELRVIASIADDARMLQAFRDNRDIHTETAAAIFATDPREVTKDQRRVAKTVNFGIIYGISAFGLSQNLKVDQVSARRFIDQYFEQFPNIKKYMDDTLDSAREKGYVETLCGRRRYIPEINAGSAQLRKAAERTAINMPIQGTAADIMKIAMVDVKRHVLDHEPDISLLLQVHDELVFEMPTGMVEAISPKIKEIMERAYLLSCPLVVDVGHGKSWGEAK